MRFLSFITKLCCLATSSALYESLYSSSILGMSFEPQFQQRRRYTRIRVQNEGDIQRLYPLILDYIREPELASSVKEFVFRSHFPLYDSYGCWNNKDRGVALTAAENARDISQEHEILRVLTDLGLEESERLEWARVLTWMKPELVAAREKNLNGAFGDTKHFYRYRDRLFAHHASTLLLLLCPNIATIKYEDGSAIVEDVLRRNNYGLLPQVHLQNLRDVVLLPTTHTTMGDTRFYIYLDLLSLLRLFHRLPSIESVITDGVGPNYDGWFLPDFPPATSNMKKIHVGHALYGGETIETLIRIPRRLEELTLTTGGRSTIDGGSYLITAKQIGQALSMHKESLRKIDIDLDDYITTSGRSFDDDYDYVEEEGRDEWYLRDEEISMAPLVTDTWKYGESIGSMHDFESLTHLSIGIKSLLGADFPGQHSHDPPYRLGGEKNYEPPFRLAEALPKSLEYLLIRGYERGYVKEYDSQIDELLLNIETCLPLLKELHGVHEYIPNAVAVDNYEDDELWKPEVSNGEWEEEMS